MKSAHLSILLIVFLILKKFPGGVVSGQTKDKLSSEGEILSLWSFDKDINGFAEDQYQNQQDSLFGKYEHVAGVKARH